jgi:hypothetical protein
MATGGYIICGEDWQSEGIENATEYYIEFEYDGVNYDTTKKSAIGTRDGSHVSEIDRAGFNSKFANIEGGTTSGATSTGNANAGGLEYAETPSGDLYTSTLITTANVDDSKAMPRVMSNLKDMFKMYAGTTDPILRDKTLWKETWGDSDYSHINMGLCERVLELSIKTDIDRADIEIIVKNNTYIYYQIKATG